MPARRRHRQGKGSVQFEFGGNPTPKDVAVFTRQFSVMIDSGVPLVQCLQILAETQENKKFAAAINGHPARGRVRKQPGGRHEDSAESVR